MHIEADTFRAMSQNVVGEIVGREKPDEVIVVSAHHDTVLGMVGADDNGSGVIATLELTRMFAKRKQRPRRTIRFISYGVEEKLSVGAYLYMRSLSAREQRRVQFVINIDTIGSTVGTDIVYTTGSPRLEQVARNVWAKRRHPAEVRREVAPYSDHFPLNICGAPSVWLGRPSIGTEGFWYLHSVHDNPLHVSPSVMARTIETAAALLDRAANEPRLPFRREIAPPVMKRVRAIAKQAYRHPWNPGTYRYPAGK
jgi:aminopeptidase YwaD